MKLSTAILVAAIVQVLACKSEPSSTPAVEKSVQPLQEEAQVEAQTPAVEDIKFYVDFELIVFQSDIETYPVMWRAFTEALYEWSVHIPIRWSVFIQPNGKPYLFYEKHRAIQIRFAELEEEGFPGFVGLWFNTENSVLLDVMLEKKPAIAYSVSLHELGHMLGVPHVIGFNDPGHTGYIVLGRDIDATQYVMYPSAIDGVDQKSLSLIEINLARNSLMFDWTIPGRSHKTGNCHLTTAR